jgi:hypothetical protein
MKAFKHTQIGYLLIVALGAAVLLIAKSTFVTNFNPTALLPLVFMILCLSLFATLTVEVKDQAINIRFGIGVIRKQFALRDVQIYRAVKNPWYYAWGIHAIPGGWILPWLPRDRIR